MNDSLSLIGHGLRGPRGLGRPSKALRLREWYFVRAMLMGIKSRAGIRVRDHRRAYLGAFGAKKLTKFREFQELTVLL